MRKLHVDIETFSKVNLKTAGLYKYAADCEVLMLTAGRDIQNLVFYDLTIEDLPQQTIAELQDPNVIKYAHNAAFEIACLSAWLGIELFPEQWVCSMALCATAGLPLSLDQSTSVLKLPTLKDKTGSTLIRYWCVPCKATKANGFRTRNLPYHEPEKWRNFCKYNVQDVRAEIALTDALHFVRISPLEKRVWDLDNKINTKGVKVNMILVRNAIYMDRVFREGLITEAIKITKLSNPNSISQIKKWLEEETNEEIESLKKSEIPKLIGRFESKIVKRVLTIREELSKTSVKKYASMLAAAGSDSRLRGLHQYYGANRTGRWAGRIVQPQNMVKGKYHGKDLELARNLVLEGDAQTLELFFGAIPDTLSQLIRTAFIADRGKTFAISDYSAIEARVIAWLAGERWRLEVFATHGRIYEASAAQMFKVPIEAVTKTSDYRAKGKISELALGYQGGVNALIKMGALTMGLEEKELKPLVDLWREANKSIVQLWYDVDRAAKKAISTGEKVVLQKGLSFEYRRNYLRINLPSGRSLYYYNASLVPGEFGVQISYWGLDQTTKKWTRLKTYGGKLVENCLAADTKVLTLRGKVPIFEITSNDLIWDGFTFVKSEGVVDKGLNYTISVNGVRMTRDHKILTNEDWKEASSCEGLNRAAVQLPNCCKLCGGKRLKISVERSLHLRRREDSRSFRTEEIKNKILWLQKVRRHWGRNEIARLLAASGLFRLAFNDRSLQITNASSVGELRWAGNCCLQEVENIPGILGGYAKNLFTRAYFRSEKRKRKLQKSELPVGVFENTSTQQKKQCLCEYPVGANNDGRSLREIRHKNEYSVLQDEKQLPGKPFILKTGRFEQVYDIVNCGPLNRFVVFDEEDKPFIVHNCVQGIARDILAQGLLNLDAAGIPVVLHVHDETVNEIDPEEVTIEEINKLMCEMPAWANGLPLAAAGFYSDYYKKD